jgi:uncharacterized protein YigA (DUF484 family)
MNKNISEEISVKEVRAYLRDHPTFLDENPDILETMIVHHKTDGAISLVDRQLSVLRDRNNEISLQLESLIEVAQENEFMFDKTRQLILNLLEAKNLASLIDSLYESLASDFGIESFNVMLFGDDSLTGLCQAKVCSLEDANVSLKSIIKADHAVCGKFSTEELNALFMENSQPIKSAATTVIRNPEYIGILSLGNSDADFYQAGMGTLFLDYIAEVLGRLLSQHLPS